MVVRIMLTCMWGVLLWSNNAFSSQTTEELNGIWINDDATRKVEFYQEKGKYFGKMVWVAEDSDARAKPGDIVFKNLVWDNDHYTGMVVTPKRGDLDCTLSWEGTDKIKIVVSKGFISRTLYWTRAV